MKPLFSYRPDKHGLKYTFGGHPPVGRLQPGQALRVYTEDCFGGRVRTASDLPSRVCMLPNVNPVSGPFYVEGAEPGDTLALHFASITPARHWAVSATFPHFGALTSTHTTATLQPPLDERVWIYDVEPDPGIVRWYAANGDRSVEMPLDPMHGTVGVAPAFGEVRATIVPDAHGGNLDTPELRAGVTAYFGVNVEGAMFSLGDGHCRQGDGELCGVAVESAMNTVLVVGLQKHVSTPWPRLESDTALMSVGVARPLDDAYRMAHHDLVTWVADLLSLDLLDAYQMVAQVSQAPIGNVCDPNYTVVAKIDKRYLDGISPYAGIHQELRRLGAIHQ